MGHFIGVSLGKAMEIAFFVLYKELAPVVKAVWNELPWTPEGGGRG